MDYSSQMANIGWGIPGDAVLKVKFPSSSCLQAFETFVHSALIVGYLLAIVEIEGWAKSIFDLIQQDSFYLPLPVAASDHHFSINQYKFLLHSARDLFLMSALERAAIDDPDSQVLERRVKDYNRKSCVVFPALRLYKGAVCMPLFI